MLITKYCLTLTIYIYIDELELQAGFMYNLNAVKEIVATESLHTLDQRTRKCDMLKMLMMLKMLKTAKLENI